LTTFLILKLNRRFSKSAPRKRDGEFARSKRPAFDGVFDFKIKTPFFKKTFPASATPVSPFRFLGVPVCLFSLSPQPRD
jgi:hypothetical protein